jgi:hypothetical protein
MLMWSPLRKLGVFHTMWLSVSCLSAAQVMLMMFLKLQLINPNVDAGNFQIT